MPAARAAATSSTAADPAVDRDEQPGAALGEPLDRRRRKPVAVVEAARDQPVAVGAELAQGGDRIAVEQTPSTS